MNSIEFKSTLPVQIRFNDIDIYGHLNNSVYFSFYDLGKTTYIDLVREKSPGLQQVEAVIANINVDFFGPVFANEEVAVQTAVSEIGNKSFKLVQRLINSKTEEVKCVCQTIMVGFDVKTGASKEIPMEWKEAIMAFEGKNLLTAKPEK